MISFLFAFAVVAQSPPVPDKSPVPLAAPSKSVPYATPQAQASPQAAYDPAPAVPVQTLILRQPSIYQVQRQVLVAADPVAYAACDTGCVAQQQVFVQRAVVHHQAAFVQRQAFAQHAVVARAPRKVVTKSRTVTKTKRGLFGR